MRTNVNAQESTRRVASQQLIRAAAVLALSLAALASVTAAASARTSSRLSASAAFGLPGAGTCLSTRTLTIRLRKVAHTHWAHVSVTLNGHQVKSVRRPRVPMSLTLHGLPSGRSVIVIVATTTRGKRVSATRTYKTCEIPKPIPPKPIPPKPVPPPPPPPPAGVRPGSFSGYYLNFDVSPDGSHIQDVSKTYVTLSCTSGATLNGQTIVINEIPITSSASFTATETEHGWISGHAVKITSTFVGNLEGSTAAGSYAMEIDYEDGSGVKCSSGTVAWTASFDSQGNQAAATPIAGSYSGYYLNFDVSPDGSHIQDVSKTYVTLYCSSGATLSGQTIVINEIPITGLTTFTKTETEKGWSAPSGEAITVSATITGHFHGLTTGGQQRVSGSYVEEVVYEGGNRCTSGAVAWTASYDSQGNQAAATPIAGSYSGYYLAFTVPSGGASIENVSKTYVTLYCSSGATLTGGTITIEAIPVVGLLSFEKTQTESSVIGGKAVEITSTFSGHFHGLDTSNNQRASGFYSQEVQYEDGSGVTCSSGAVAWTASS